MGAVVLFSLQDFVGIYPTVVALVATVILLFIGGPKMPNILNEVEWSTLIFSCVWVAWCAHTHDYSSLSCS